MLATAHEPMLYVIASGVSAGVPVTSATIEPFEHKLYPRQRLQADVLSVSLTESFLLIRSKGKAALR